MAKGLLQVTIKALDSVTRLQAFWVDIEALGGLDGMTLGEIDDIARQHGFTIRNRKAEIDALVQLMRVMEMADAARKIEEVG